MVGINVQQRRLGMAIGNGVIGIVIVMFGLPVWSPVSHVKPLFPYPAPLAALRCEPTHPITNAIKYN